MNKTKPAPTQTDRRPASDQRLQWAAPKLRQLDAREAQGGGSGSDDHALGLS